MGVARRHRPPRGAGEPVLKSGRGGCSAPWTVAFEHVEQIRLTSASPLQAHAHLCGGGRSGARCAARHRGGRGPGTRGGGAETPTGAALLPVGTTLAAPLAERCLADPQRPAPGGMRDAVLDYLPGEELGYRYPAGRLVDPQGHRSLEGGGRRPPRRAVRPVRSRISSLPRRRWCGVDPLVGRLVRHPASMVVAVRSTATSPPCWRCSA